MLNILDYQKNSDNIENKILDSLNKDGICILINLFSLNVIEKI